VHRLPPRGVFIRQWHELCQLCCGVVCFIFWCYIMPPVPLKHLRQLNGGYAVYPVWGWGCFCAQRYRLRAVFPRHGLQRQQRHVLAMCRRHVPI